MTLKIREPLGDNLYSLACLIFWQTRVGLP